MRILYLSKALAVAAYRDKLHDLSMHAQVTAVTPRRWGRGRIESGAEFPDTFYLSALVHGHNHLHLYRGLSGVIDTVRPDVVHIDEEPYSAVTCQTAWICRRREIPCVFFAAQNLVESIPWPFVHTRRYVYDTVVGGMAGTAGAAEVLRRTGFRATTAIIPQMGVDPSRFAPDATDRCHMRVRLGYSAADFVVGFAGRLVPEKGVETLIEAVSRVSGVRLLVIGEGPLMANLRERVIQAGVAGRVRFVGHVHSLKMPHWLAALDALVLPSIPRPGRLEQFGRVLVEAMACGVPVIGSRCGGIPGVIGDAGDLVPPGHVRALSQAIERVVSDQGLRAARAAAGRDRVLRLYSNQRIAEETMAFYRRVVPAPALA